MSLDFKLISTLKNKFFLQGVRGFMSKRAAVMDLGTNTFHLLIAEASSSNFKVIAKDYEPVKLGEGGINNGTIKPDNYQRGINTMQRFADRLREHNIQAGDVKALATSMLRSSSNGKDFVDEVKAKTGIAIEVINGDQEAGYIYHGIKASGALTDETALIIDIGGGSVEFIICNRKEVFWKQSFEIGAVRIKELYFVEDPIPQKAINELYAYLNTTLQPLLTAAKQYPVKKIIGSAGSFETFAEIVERIHGSGFDVDNKTSYDFDPEEFIIMTDRLIISTNEERQAMKSIIPFRVNTIVVASLLTRFVMRELSIEEISMSTYSLKEGVIALLMA